MHGCECSLVTRHECPIDRYVFGMRVAIWPVAADLGPHPAMLDENNDIAHRAWTGIAQLADEFAWSDGFRFDFDDRTEIDLTEIINSPLIRTAQSNFRN